MSQRGSLEERIWRRVDKSAGPDGCWLWLGAKSGRGGHGVIGRGGRGDGLVLVHRATYEMKYGPIPAGFNACHKCDNPPCCNPDHIFIGTHTDNMHDAELKGRMRNGRRPEDAPRGNSHWSRQDNARVAKGNDVLPKLSEQDVRDIRASRLPSRVLAEHYSTTPQTIRAARKGKTYAWVQP